MSHPITAGLHQLAYLKASMGNASRGLKLSASKTGSADHVTFRAVSPMGHVAMARLVKSPHTGALEVWRKTEMGSPTTFRNKDKAYAHIGSYFKRELTSQDKTESWLKGKKGGTYRKSKSGGKTYKKK